MQTQDLAIATIEHTNEHTNDRLQGILKTTQATALFFFY